MPSSQLMSQSLVVAQHRKKLEMQLSSLAPVQQPVSPSFVVQLAPAAVQVSGTKVVNGSKVFPPSGPSSSVVVAPSPPWLDVVDGS